MVKRLPIFMLILSIPAAFAQLDSNSITVTATQTMAQQPDQVLFGVTVQSGVSASLDDVVAALQGSGITAANFVGVSTAQSVIVNPLLTGPSPMLQLQWSFTLTAPLAKIKTTIATLASLQQTIGQQNSSLTLSFNVQGTQVSAQSQQMQVCPTSALLTDATSQAQQLASAAGLSLGSVLAMSSGASGSYSGAYTAIGSLSSFFLGAPSSACSLTVKFGVLRY
jgi:hypothetical protein